MALEDIIKKILAEAEKKAQSILTQARQEAGEVQKEAEIKARNLSQEIIQAKEIQARQETVRIVSLTRLEARKATLIAKQRLLNQIFTHQRVLKSAKTKKELILPDQEKQEELDPGVYLELLRRGYEARVAQILFGKQ